MFGIFKRKAPDSTPVEATKPHWFDSTVLNATFEQLQSAVAETSSLAANISNQIENRLQTTEEQLSTILFVVTEGIIIVDYRGIVQEWNTGAEIIFGYTKQDAVNKHINELIAHSEDCTEITRRFTNTVPSADGNMNRVKPLRCITKDGNEVLVEVSINTFPSVYANPRPNMIAIVRDVTEQTREREAHEKERTMLAAILNATTDLVIIKDPAGRWIRANKAACQAYGFNDVADYNNRTDEEIAAIFPEHANGLEECMKTDALAWRGYRTSRSEEVLVDPQGQRHYFDVLKTPVYHDATTKEMLVVSARNITQLKEKREQINVAYKALNASSDVIVITDGDGCIMFANKMFMIKYRFVDNRDVIGKRMSIVRSTKTPSKQHQEMWSTIKQGKQWEGQIINQDTTGKEVIVDTTIIPIVDSNLDTPYYIYVQKCVDC